MNDEARLVDASTTDPTFAQIAKPIFLGWEKLRLVYLFVNGLFCISLFISSGGVPTLGTLYEFCMICLAAGFGANVCYFAGPVVESYAAWLGFRYHKWLRPVLFILGTLFTLLGALIVLASALIPIDERF